MKFRLGFSTTDRLPYRPPPDLVAEELDRINHGLDAHNRFMYDLGADLNSTWNICVQKYFFYDFWAAVQAQTYVADGIPPIFQEREPFARVFNRHMMHLKRMAKKQQKPFDATDDSKYKKHYARNSRIMTVSTYSIERQTLTRQTDVQK